MHPHQQRQHYRGGLTFATPQGKSRTTSGVGSYAAARRMPGPGKATAELCSLNERILCGFLPRCLACSLLVEEKPLPLTVHRHGDEAVVVLGHELNVGNAHTLEQELEALASPAVRVVIVDLRPAEYVDSTGLSVLMRGQQRATENEQRFAVVRGQERVQRLFSLTGVAEQLTLVDTPEELLSDPG